MYLEPTPLWSDIIAIKSLIDNTIKYKILDDNSDKSCKFYMQNLDLLYRKNLTARGNRSCQEKEKGERMAGDKSDSPTFG